MDYSTRLPPRKRLLAEIKTAQNSDSPDDPPSDSPPILPSQFHSGELRARVQSLLDHRHSDEEFAEASTLVALAADRIAADARAGALLKAEIAARVKSFAKSVLDAAAAAAAEAAAAPEIRPQPRPGKNRSSSSLPEDGGVRSNAKKHQCSAVSLKENKGTSAKSKRSTSLEEEGGDLGNSPTVEVIKKGKLRKKRVLLSIFCGAEEGNKATSNAQLSPANSDSVAGGASDRNESILKPKKLKLSGFYKGESVGAAASIRLKQQG